VGNWKFGKDRRVKLALDRYLELKFIASVYISL